jgi:hypothetical protein
VIEEWWNQWCSEVLERWGLHPLGAVVALLALHLELDAVFKPRVAERVVLLPDYISMVVTERLLTVDKYSF